METTRISKVKWVGGFSIVFIVTLMHTLYFIQNRTINLLFFTIPRYYRSLPLQKPSTMALKPCLGAESEPRYARNSSTIHCLWGPRSTVLWQTTQGNMAQNERKYTSRITFCLSLCYVSHVQQSTNVQWPSIAFRYFCSMTFGIILCLKN